MTDRHFGFRNGARTALALALAGGMVVPGFAQQADAPAPSTSRPIDFRLPPAENDGRTPGVQGPANNGIGPVGPGETRPTPTPTPVPTPTAPPRVSPTQPAVQPRTPSATPSDAAPARRAPATETVAPTPKAAADAPTPTEASDPADVTPGDAPTTLEVTEELRPAAASGDDLAPPSAPAAGDGGTSLWAWLLALLAAGVAGFWYWRRRPALASDAPVERNAVPAEPRPAAPPAPRAAPIPAAKPAPAGAAAVQRTPSPLVTRPAPERRAAVSLALEVVAIRVMADRIGVDFALNLANQGAVDATGLMVRIAFNQGSAMTETVLVRFFDGAGGSVLRDNMELKAGADEVLTTEVMLPRQIVDPLMIGGKPMLVPVIAFDVTYHWEGDDPDAFGQVAGSFVLGRESGASDGGKLAPLPLDRVSYVVERPGARPTVMRRSQ